MFLLASNIGTTLLVTTSLASAAVTRRQNAPSAPTVAVKNGTYVGHDEPAYGTDYFLGMPYAQPPVGTLRFHTPVSLNSSWSGSKIATEHGPECIGYGLDTASQGKNFVFEQNVASHPENDVYRAEGIQYIGKFITARQEDETVQVSSRAAQATSIELESSALSRQLLSPSQILAKFRRVRKWLVRSSSSSSADSAGLCRCQTLPSTHEIHRGRHLPMFNISC